LQEQVEERLAQRGRALPTQVAFDRAHCGGHPLVRAIYGDAERESGPQAHRARPQDDNEALTLGDRLGLFAEVLPERQRASPPQRPTSPTSSQPHYVAYPYTQPQPPVRENAEVNLGNILEFFHNIAAQDERATGEQSTHEVSLPVLRVCVPLSNICFTAEFAIST
jgi:hypothetical protein